MQGKKYQENATFTQKHNYYLDILTTGLQPKNPTLNGSYIKTNYVLEYVLDGEGVIKIDKKAYKIKKGDLVLLPLNQAIEFFANPSNPFTYLWVDFFGENIGYVLTQIGFNEKKHRIYYGDDKIAELMQKTNDAQRGNSLPSSLSALSHFFELLSYLISLNTTDSFKSNFIDEYLSKALWYMHANFDSDIKVSDIAKHVNISEFYLTSIFTKNIGTSPIDYLISYRIKQAQNMLTSQDTPITLISSSCGFNSTSYFTMRFKQIVGMTPSEYRKNHPRINP